MLRHRTDDLRAFGASDPGGKGKWLGVHVLEAGCFQPGLGPSDRPPMAFGAGQTLSDLGGQRCHEIEGGGIVERSLSEAGCGDDQRIRRLRVGGHRCSSACREGSRNDKNPRYLAHGIAPSPIYCGLDRSVSSSNVAKATVKVRIVFSERPTYLTASAPVWPNSPGLLI